LRTRYLHLELDRLEERAAPGQLLPLLELLAVRPTWPGLQSGVTDRDFATPGNSAAVVLGDVSSGTPTLSLMGEYSEGGYSTSPPALDPSTPAMPARASFDSLDELLSGLPSSEPARGLDVAFGEGADWAGVTLSAAVLRAGFLPATTTSNTTGVAPLPLLPNRAADSAAYSLVANPEPAVHELVFQMAPGFEAEIGGARRLAAEAGATFQSMGAHGLFQIQSGAVDLRGVMGQLASDPRIASVEIPSRVSITLNPNDTYYVDGSLWGMNGTNGIRAPQAWDNTTGATNISIGVVDTGIDYNHPDLYKNIWVNQGEIPAANKAQIQSDPSWDIDADGLITFWDLNDPRNQGPGEIQDTNFDGRITATDLLAPIVAGGWANEVSDNSDGYVDDLIGWNFVANNNNPFDDQGHGTHVAGTIGAMGNNALGVVGVNWKTQLMALKFLDSSGSGTDAGAALATYYAADLGSRVSNHSYGAYVDSTTLFNAMNYANGRGHVVVAGAGNDSIDNDLLPFYPASFSLANVVAVASTTSGGLLSSFSNYGLTSVDLGAPGSLILSTVPGGYGYKSGTSMATPHVAGVFGLVFTQNPTWTVAQARNQVLSTVTPLSSLAGRTVTGGLVNAQGATALGPEIQVLDGATDIADGSGSVSFGSTWLGVPITKTFTVKNLGTSNLTLTPPINVPAGFTVTSSFGSTTVIAGGSTTFAVRLDAATAGSYSGTLSFANNDSNENPFNFTLSGTVGSKLFLDNGDPGYSESGSGWFSGALGGAYRSDYRYHAAGSGTNKASWTGNALPTGAYKVYATWLPHANRASNAPYTVFDGAVSEGTRLLNQRNAPNDLFDDGVWWELVGEYTITNGSLRVDLSDGANGYVIADGMRIEISGPPPTHPDLAWTSISAPGTVTRGAPFNVNRTYVVRDLNVGPDFVIAYYLSTNSTFGDADDTVLGSESITTTGGKAVGSHSGLSPSFSIGAVGTYYIFARIDDTGAVAESQETNNVSSWTSIIVTAPPTIIDDGDAGYSEVGGGWGTGTLSGAYNNDYRYSPGGGGSNRARWLFSSVASGTVQVYTTWKEHSNRATNAPYSIFDGAVLEQTVFVNQRSAPNDVFSAGVWWELLGTYAITNGSLTVELTNGANGYVVADAIRLT
jgi:subtilisin family serine protease